MTEPSWLSRGHGKGLARLSNVTGKVAQRVGASKATSVRSIAPMVQQQLNKATAANGSSASKASAARSSSPAKRASSPMKEQPKNSAVTNDLTLMKANAVDGTTSLTSDAVVKAINARGKKRKKVLVSPRGSKLPAPGAAAGPPLKKSLFDRVMGISSTTSFQLILYIAYVGVFQYFADALRKTEEYYMDQHVMDTFVKRPFGPTHRTFESTSSRTRSLASS